MSGARDAGIMVAHRLFAAPLEIVVVEIQPALDDTTQVVLDGQLVLGRRSTH